MILNRLELDFFRNYPHLEADFDPRVNLIYGDNAQGKTNLLEAVAYLSSARSHRARYDREMILLGVDAAFLKGELSSRGRDFTLEAKLFRGKGRQLWSNGVRLKTAGELAGIFTTVLFCPEDLSLVRAGGAERRKFLDLAICQLMPRYVDILSRYNRILRQRNALLKELRFGNISYGPQTLEVFDDALSKTAVSVIRARQRYISRLAQAAGDIYQGISRENETMTLRYLSGIPPLEELSSQQILSHLRQNRQADIAAAATLYGPHRDDLGIDIDHNAARSFGSQGQQRSCILSLKLAESIIIEETTGQSPIILLDDVMSELDRSRRDYLLNHLQGKQVFITCCETAYFQTLEQGRCFLIGEGSIRQTFDLCRAQRDETPQDSL